MTALPMSRLSPDKQSKMKSLARLEWATLAFLVSIIVVMSLTMGSSQAMRTAWMEDLLSLVPPLCILIALRIEKRPANPAHPYGYRRAMLLSFLGAAVAILMFGLFMLYESASKLITQHHPSLGAYTIFGHSWSVWSGWVMIPALIYSMIPPIILGRVKYKLAKELHLQALAADATMNKDDWLTAGAAIVGILGVGMGLWWADAVAAGVIALNVLHDGIKHMKNSLSALMDHRPMEIDGEKPLKLEERIRDEVLQMPAISRVRARLREEGQTISGEILVALVNDRQATRALREVLQRAREVDWRLHDLVVVPVEPSDARLEPPP